ncbi:AT-rich interactive domain-containing protein 3-like [Salvia splendens]|uniref:AT-rich interactive domain-containing protein 3-like n=1 Tax=Salvia splendens TaxID=180675 RepID=UPI001C27C967|nr:AT-rich interactive domain-containing protein 3-like [Salvia splendens]
MSKSDVEMEDAKIFHGDSGNNIKESECQAVDPKVEGSEEVPSASEDGNRRENVDEDLNKVIDDKIEDKMDVEEQTNPVKEASGPIEGSNCGIIITKSDDEEPIYTETAASDYYKEQINTETPGEAETAARSAVEKQGDTKFEVVECDATILGVKEGEPNKNDVVDGNQGDGEKRPNEDVDVKFEVVKCDATTNSGLKEDQLAKNDMVDGNQGDDVEKIPNEDVVKKSGEICNDTDDTECVSGESVVENVGAGNVPTQNRQLQTDFFANEDPQGYDANIGDVQPRVDEEMGDVVHCDQDNMVKYKEQGAESFLVSHETHGNEKTSATAAELAEESSLASQPEPLTPNSLIRCSSQNTADRSREMAQPVSSQAALPFMGEDDDGTPEDQAAFMKELEHFYREMTMEFKPPKFYGQPLNCLKLWRAVIRLGGYDRVTGSKLWRQVGESFHPPKTCTTVSWTFRIFYEKSLLEYERHKTQSSELQLPVVMLPEVSAADGEGNGYQGPGSGPGRARRDSATRAMQGWHAQRLGSGEVEDQVIKDKNLNSMAKNEKNLKSISLLKQKRPNEVEDSSSSKATRTDISKQLVTSVVDVRPPADWVKINVRQTKECFEVYALVPGLLREEVRVQSDPAGRLVITGQPEQVDNPWGITPFKKVISLPARIQPVQTSAVVSLHGRLFVRIPIEQPNI